MAIDSPKNDFAEKHRWLTYADEVDTVYDGSKIMDGSVTTDKLADYAVTTDKIDDESITLGKMDTDVLSLLEGGVKAFDTVTDMQAATLTAGDICHTDGFHVSGDGGAAFYKITATGTANGMDVLACGDLLAHFIITTKYVTPEMFGAVSGGLTDSTLQIQKAVDLSSHVKIEGEYLVSKNIAFGESASCVNIEQDNVLIDGGGTLHVNAHAQSIIGINDASNVTIRNLTLEGYGSFPELEGTTGRGEKGTDTAGYQTSGFWCYYFNNSYDTSEFTTHSPQGSGVAWGTFGNGFIGNVGSGVLITGKSSNITIDGIEASGFNGAGVTVGHYSDVDIKRNVIVRNCYIHDCYNSGVDMCNYDGLEISNCTIEDIGHPDAEITDTVNDPGYGTSCMISDNSKNTIISNNHITNCVRKGIDAHGANTILVNSNVVDNAWSFGIAIEGNGTTSFVRNATISNNVVKNSSYAYQASGAIRCGMGADSAIDDCNIIISGNQIIDCGYQDTYGFIVSMLFNNLDISNNLISGYHTRVDTATLSSAITVGSTRGNSGVAVVHGNIIDLSQYTVYQNASTYTVHTVKCNATCFGNAISGNTGQKAFGVSGSSNQRTYINTFGNSYDSVDSGSSIGAGSGYLQIPTSNGNPTKTGALSGTGNVIRYLAPNGTLYAINMTAV